MADYPLQSDTDTVEVVAEVENPHVRIVEINGRKYNEIFDPVNRTTRLEPLLE